MESPNIVCDTKIMAENAPERVYDIVINGVTRTISYINSLHVSDGVDSDIYTFIDDNSQVLSIVKVKRGFKSPFEKIMSHNKVIEGFLKGKGTLTVTIEGGTKNEYYFENEGYNKVIELEYGQTIQWTAPKNDDLVYYKIRDLPEEQISIKVPEQPKKPSKLFLSSVSISDAQSSEFVKLIGKPRNTIKLALIENAADVEDGSERWVLSNRRKIESHGFNVELVNLKQFTNRRIELLEVLQTKHAIWLGGGNTFYLNWLLKTTRCDDIIKYLVGRGMIYGGGSAGAILAGPTLKYWETADDPNVVPEIGLDGLRLTELVVIPHTDNPKFEKITKDVNKKLIEGGFNTVPLKDDQALIIDGETIKII